MSPGPFVFLSSSFPNLYLSNPALLVVGLSFKAIEPWRQAGTTIEDLSNFFEFCPETGKSIPNDIPPNSKDKTTSPESHQSPGWSGIFSFIIGHCSVTVSVSSDTLTNAYGPLLGPQIYRSRGTVLDVS